MIFYPACPLCGNHVNNNSGLYSCVNCMLIFGTNEVDWGKDNIGVERGKKNGSTNGKRDDGLYSRNNERRGDCTRKIKKTKISVKLSNRKSKKRSI